MLKKFLLLVGGVLLSTSMNAAEKTTSPYIGITIEQAAGRSDLYLYNVESGLWLQENNRRSDSWNTRGELDAYGFDVAITAIEGGYQIDPKFNANHSVNANNWYLDTGNPVTAWTFEPIEKEGVSNAYKIKAGESLWMHAMPEDDANASFGLIVNDRDVRSTWQIITRDERITYLEQNATVDNPLDATFLIRAHNLAENDSRRSSWKTEQNGGNSDWNREYMCLSAHGFWNSTNVKYSQTIENVPDGYYEFWCTGFYRDGNREQVQERRAAGTEKIRGFYFINNTRAPMKSILDGAQPEKTSGFQYAADGAPYGYFPDGGVDVTKCFFTHPDAYLNAPIRVFVLGGIITLGIDKTNYTGGGDWVFFTRFRMNYLGPVDISVYTDTLNAAIADAEAYTGNTTDILASNLATALAAAKALTDSHDTDAITAAIGALNTALNAAKAVDDTILEQTIILASAEGIDVAQAEDVTSSGLTAVEVDNALRILRNARKLLAVDKQEDIFVGAEPEDGGKYYIYNIGAKRYLTGGVDFGTHAAVNFAAQLATFTKVGDGFRIHTNIRNGSDALNHNGFVDCAGDGDTWYLIKVSEGVYNISKENSNTGGTLLGYSGERRGNWWQVDTDNSGANEEINQWKFITKEERDALLEKASEENPIDATYYIHAAGFDHHLVDATMEFPTQQWSQWWVEGHEGNHGFGGWEPDFNFETWNAGNFKLSQELTGLKPGKYILGVQGYYRHGNREQAADEAANGNTKSDGAILYAINGDGLTYSGYLVPIVSEVNKAPGYGWESPIGQFPDNRGEEVANYFELGLYKNTIEVVVGEDGKLTIGVEKFENEQGHEWVVLDNFRLTCIGLTVPVTISAAATDGTNNYGTLYYSDKNLVAPEGIGAYTATVADGEVTLTKIEGAIPAGTGVVLKTDNKLEQATTFNFAVSSTAGTAATDNMLNGTDVQTEISGEGFKYYMLSLNGQGEENSVGFYWGKNSEGGTKLVNGAHKAYLAVPNDEALAKGYPFGGDATGIEGLIVNGDENAAEVYDLQGRNLQNKNLPKGIYIVNGKKVVKK